MLRSRFGTGQKTYAVRSARPKEIGLDEALVKGPESRARLTMNCAAESPQWSLDHSYHEEKSLSTAKILRCGLARALHACSRPICRNGPHACRPRVDARIHVAWTSFERDVAVFRADPARIFYAYKRLIAPRRGQARLTENLLAVHS